MASEMIERVANAMREAADVGSETMYEDMARAAIEALTTDDLLKEIDRRLGREPHTPPGGT